MRCATGSHSYSNCTLAGEGSHMSNYTPSNNPISPPSDLEQSFYIQMSSLTLCSLSPWRWWGQTRRDCFLIAGKRKKREPFLGGGDKYLVVKWSRWNEVLFCFIFDVGKTSEVHRSSIWNHGAVAVNEVSRWLHSWLFQSCCDLRMTREC